MTFENIFISDLHLNGSDQERALRFRALLQYLQTRTTQCEVRLYILGDLFHFWEEYHSQVQAIYAKDLQALEDASQAGVRIFLLYGNRDFLFNQGVLPKRCNATIIGDGGRIASTRGNHFWIEHGDLLCTDDTRYLRFRKIIRSAPMRAFFRCLPWSLAKRFIGNLEARSGKDKARKPQKVFAINQTLAAQRLTENESEVLLCGHTHKPQELALPDNKRLIVLPAWFEKHEGYWEHDGALEKFSTSPQGAMIIE